MIKISCIIPVWNQKPEYFKEALESVLNQTRKPDEIIIVDDGCDKPIIDDFTSSTDIKIIRNEKNMGIGFSRQRGVDNASKETDYIAFLSSDDIWDKDFLKIMIETAIQQPGKILYSNHHLIDNNRKIISTFSSPNFNHSYEDFCIACWNWAYKNTMFVSFSTTFFPKKVFEKVQFDKDLRFGEDLDFLLRSMKHFKYFLVTEHLLKYRAIDNTTSRVWDKIPENNIKIREKCLEYWKHE